MLLLLAEGSSNRTFTQLATVLKLPNDLSQIRKIFKHFQHVLTGNNAAISLSMNQVMFFDVNRPIDIDFQYKLEQDYEADYYAVDFLDAVKAMKKINDYVRQKVNGKIDDVVNLDAVSAAQMILVSAIFFQGQWEVSQNI